MVKLNRCTCGGKPWIHYRGDTAWVVCRGKCGASSPEFTDGVRDVVGEDYAIDWWNRHHKGGKE